MIDALYFVVVSTEHALRLFPGRLALCAATAEMIASSGGAVLVELAEGQHWHVRRLENRAEIATKPPAPATPPARWQRATNATTISCCCGKHKMKSSRIPSGEWILWVDYERGTAYSAACALREGRGAPPLEPAT